MKFEFLEHTADIKFRAYGKNLEIAFKNSALALKESICGKIKIKEKEKKKIKVKGKDLESLLYNFLEEFLYFIDAEDFIIEKIEKLKLNKEDFTLSATLVGDKASSYEFTNDVKAITYNEMVIKKESGKWVVQVVLDV
jgi:SHS2 domain-containing protein